MEENEAISVSLAALFNKTSSRRWEHLTHLGETPSPRLEWWFNRTSVDGKERVCPEHMLIPRHMLDLFFFFQELCVGGTQKYLENVRFILPIFPKAQLNMLKYMKDRVLNWVSRQLNIWCQHSPQLASFLCASPFTNLSLVFPISERMRCLCFVYV